MRITQSFTFYCRKSKQNKQGLSPLELSIVINGERQFVNLPMKFNPDDFSKKRKPAIIQTAINEWYEKINHILVDMMQKDIPLTTSHLREFIKTGGIPTYTAENLFKDYLDIIKKRVGKTMIPTVYRKYELVMELFFQEFDKTKEVTEITNSVVLHYFATLDEKYKNATANGYKQKFKTFILFGIDNNYIKINPLQNIKIIRERKPIDYLTSEEINKIETLTIQDNPSMEHIRDCAIFQLCSGMAYCDCCSLQPDDLKYKDGTYYISKRRKKTGTPFYAVILPKGVEVFNKYNGHLPLISNQKYNLYLKVLADLTNIKKNLHTHLFRHTYCTVLLNNNVSLNTIAKCVGHSSTKVTETFYAHLEESTVLSEVREKMY